MLLPQLANSDLELYRLFRGSDFTPFRQLYLVVLLGEQASSNILSTKILLYHHPPLNKP